ncbi:MAG: transglutaminase TgpA family protein, partial [Methylococcales bacterium]
LIVFEHRSLIGINAGASFFLVSLSLKILEVKQVRDLYVVIFLCFFVAITQFLFTQSVFMMFYIVVMTVLLVAALIGLSSGAALAWKRRLKLAGLLVLQAIPFTIFLFILFPRIPSPRIGLASQTAQSGLGNSMQPGQISRLSQSSELVFRVDFKGSPPPPRDRYWRGPVFWHTDGTTWTRGNKPALPIPPVRLFGPRYDYEITLEPHGRHWLLALDLPASQAPASSLNSEYVLSADKSVLERISYALVSYTQYNTGSLSDAERNLGLELPARPSPRMVALVDSWQGSATDAAAMVQKALNYFHEEEFYYTLSPPFYPNNPDESFLFESKRGFCEHFASAFVYLMRVAKIPARVVTGYQGGEFNTFGSFLEIRQSDAHAWAEVWLPDRGWLRVDPTAAVAPQRIERGIESMLLDTQSLFGLNARYLAESGGIFESIRFAWSSLDHAWHQWVLTYSAFKQNEMLSRFGLEDLQSLVFSLIAALTACLALTAFFVLKPSGAHLDKALRLYRRFCRKLAKAGFDKRESEGASDFAQRIIAQRPELSHEILRITGLYHEIRYGRFHSGKDLKDLTQAIQGLRIRTRQPNPATTVIPGLLRWASLVPALRVAMRTELFKPSK